VADHRPDVVVLTVTDWARDEIQALAGSADPAAQEARARRVLGSGLDVLSADGAAIVWAPGPVTLAEAINVRRGPFFYAMERLLVERPAIRRSETVSNQVEDLVDAVRLYAPGGAAGGRRVLVVGDSSARTVGYGLERWARQDGSAVVWSAGTEGCGIADEGSTLDSSGRDSPVTAQCKQVTDVWREQVASFDPDVVVVLSTRFDLQPRRLDGWAGPRAPGDPEFDRYLLAEYEQAVDVLTCCRAVAPASGG
jgi:hypothetical protein